MSDASRIAAAIRRSDATVISVAAPGAAITRVFRATNLETGETATLLVGEPTRRMWGTVPPGGPGAGNRNAVGRRR
jgi:hypothetical protein